MSEPACTMPIDGECEVYRYIKEGGTEVTVSPTGVTERRFGDGPYSNESRLYGTESTPTGSWPQGGPEDGRHTIPKEADE